MIRKTLLFLFGAVVYFNLSAQDPDTSIKKISLLFLGDIMGHDEQIWSAENRETKTFNYDTVFSYIRDEISEADIAIANFEVTMAGPPYTGYPAFSSPVELAVACKNAGIDILATANNHSADKGRRGITGTIDRLDSLGIPHTGTFYDNKARDTICPLIVKKNGISLALLNYTYGTNGITVPPPLVVNYLDKNIVASDIQKARTFNPDAIILFLHWGTEYDTVPSAKQVELAEFFFGQGADLIIGSHPHVIQKMIWNKRNQDSKDRIVFYSLGNFVSNQRRAKTDGGTMARIVLAKKADSLFVSDAAYYLTWVYTPIENYRKRFFVLPCSKFENKPQFFVRKEDYQKMRNFILNSRKLLYEQNILVNELIYSGNQWLY